MPSDSRQRRFSPFIGSSRSISALKLLAAALVLLCAAGSPACSGAPSAAASSGTRLFDLNGVATGLLVGTRFAGAGGPWVGVKGSSLQARLIALLPRVQGDLFRVPEAHGFAATSADRINQALEKAGVSIRLQPWPDDRRHFGVAAFLKVEVRWRVAGETHEGNDRRAITVAGGKPAFRLTAEDHGVAFGRLDTSREPVVIVPTQSRDTVYMLRSDQKPADELSMFEFAETIARTEPSRDWEYTGVDIPDVDADQQVDLSWMSALRTGTWYVDQALQEVKLKMNHLGATAESGTAIGGVTGPPPSYYVIDGPFFLVITRPGVRTPVFAGYIGLDSFGDPG